MTRRLQALLETIPLHPFLVPLAVCAALVTENQHRLELPDALPTLLLLEAAVAALVATLAWPFGLRKAGFAATVIAFHLFYVPALAKAPQGWLGLSELATQGSNALLALAGLAFVLRRRGRLRGATLLLNLAALVMPVPAIAGVVAYQAKVREARERSLPVFADTPTAPERPADADPDVWHLVLDRYADAETLARVYGWDNEPFLRELESRGFFVARNAAANYQRTGHSLAATLSLEYLDPLAAAMGPATNDWVPLYRILADHRVGRFFAGAGYRYVHLGSWWEPTRRNRRAHENRNLRDLPEFTRNLIAGSAFGRVSMEQAWGPAAGRRDQCERIRFKFDELERLADDPARTYVLAHLLVPHPPYVIDERGECVDLETAAARTRAENYLGQLRYANRRLLALVDRILARADRPPVIVLQADEGPWPEAYVADERVIARDAKRADWSKASREELREKVRILNALYLPGEPKPELPDTLSPVNTYRIILDRYFGTRLGMLPDRSYVFERDAELYRFVEVTQEVR